jgi:hypothetical protein
VTQFADRDKFLFHPEQRALAVMILLFRGQDGGYSMYREIKNLVREPRVRLILEF